MKMSIAMMSMMMCMCLHMLSLVHIFMSSFLCEPVLLLNAD